ncbi:hypothetical protein [Paenibacillus sp. Marseille-Q4541]|uniref:hypothetical protein n=1 Tax=Paenibacillus sp. Marseille-Q4541 TaxID=2831522 RepID=UPI001BAAE0A1|nr:hypothetical protein [Paenibacillus sp. Marseille-Q4541]
MMACWIAHPDGIALIDEQANHRGLLIELPIQRVGQGRKWLETPSEWFRIDENKQIKSTKGNQICQVTTRVG